MKNFLDDNLGNDSSTRAGTAPSAPRCREVPGVPRPGVPEPAGSGGDGVTDAQLKGFAETAGITGDALTTWQTCFDAGKYADYVNSVEAQSFEDGVRGTPTVRIDGEIVELGSIGSPSCSPRPSRRHRDDLHIAGRADPDPPAPAPRSGSSTSGRRRCGCTPCASSSGSSSAVWLTGRRLVPRGGEPGRPLDVAAYAVLFGIVGGRLYHVITTPDPTGARTATRRRAEDLGGRPRHLGRGLARGAGGVDRLSPLRRAVPCVRRCRRARGRVRPGHRPVRQLVQQRAVRRTRRRLPWGLEIHEGLSRRAGPSSTPPATRSCWGCSTRPSSTSRSSSCCSGSCCSSSTGDAPGAGSAPRAVRGRLPGRADRHRDDAHRRVRADPRAAAQRLDEHRRVPPGGLDHLVHRAPRPARGDRWMNRVPGCGIAASDGKTSGARRYPSGTWPEPSAPDLAVPGPWGSDDLEDGDPT